MGLKDANPNGGNVIASHLHRVYFFFENCEDWTEKQGSYICS